MYGVFTILILCLMGLALACVSVYSYIKTDGEIGGGWAFVAVFFFIASCDIALGIT